MSDDEKGYILALCDGYNGDTSSNVSEGYTQADIEDACEEWCLDGDWANEDGDAAEVSIAWTVTDADGVEVDSGTHEVQIPHDEKRKVKLAGGDHRCDHDWERDERVGCKENPGVMGLGGTAISVTDICAECGIVRSTRHNGSQRNPGQPETEVSYYCAEVS